MKKCKFPEIVVKDLAGNDFSYGNINKSLGGSIYMMATNGRLQEIGKELYEKEEVELSADDIQMMIPIINDLYIPLMLKTRIIHYLTAEN